MITGVPSYEDLESTAKNWLLFAWREAISAYQEISSYSKMLEPDYNNENKEDLDYHINDVVQSYNLELNNSISLLQQSLDLFLKARIAKISPFLLIVGDVSTWPNTDKNGNVDFSEFKTVDATNLCRAIKIVSSDKLHIDFPQLYASVRKKRNKIIHLIPDKHAPEAKDVMLLIMKSQSQLFPDQRWQEFRADKQGLNETDHEEETHDVIMRELSNIIDALDSKDLKHFMGIHKRKKFLDCPSCMSLKSKWYDETYDFAQLQKDGSIYCFACQYSYTNLQLYKDKLKEWL